MSYPFIIQGDNVVVVIGNQSHTISKTHITYNQVVAAIKANDWDLVKATIEPKKAVEKFGNGNVKIVGDKLFWKGDELHSSLAVRMISMLQEGFPIEPMVLFMEKLMLNPSRRSVQELYGFLEKSNLPITPDGHFLAYKKVRADYRDCHSGTMDNSVGQIVEMERNMVDDDKDRTCSAGLHFCSQSYLGSFGGDRTVILKINPRDVVSIPSDYNDAKGRACRYEVIGELAVAPDDAFKSSVQTTAVGSAPVAQSSRNAPGTKTGSTPFYKGYDSGFSGVAIQGIDHMNDVRGMNAKDLVTYGEGFCKGQVAARYGYIKAYAYVKPVQAEPNKAVDSKSGSTPFYKGYTAGYAGGTGTWHYTNQRDQKNYDEGFERGEDDAFDGAAPRYVFVEAQVQVAKGAWPNPRNAWKF